jgi:transcriptional regulator with XRE-family HTH domain
MHIGEKIKKLRKELNLSQTNLARLAKLKSPTICQYEKGKRIPTMNSLRALSRVLNVPIETLISDETTGQINDDCTDLYYLFIRINNLSDKSKDEVIKYVDYLNYLDNIRKE